MTDYSLINQIVLDQHHRFCTKTLWKLIKEHTKLSKLDIYYGFCGNCSMSFVNGLCECRIRHLKNALIQNEISTKEFMA